MSEHRQFTSESVSPGHPDKLADKISDAVLDALIRQDSGARVAVETMVTPGLVIIGGEVRSPAYAGLDLPDIARGVICDAGYVRAELGMDGRACGVIDAVNKQSPEIAQKVDAKDGKPQGAGDQGMMFGYASNEMERCGLDATSMGYESMPLPISLAHALTRRHAELRKLGDKSPLAWLRPDAKSQVTVRYGDDGLPTRIDAVVLSTQHDPSVSVKELRAGVKKHIIDPALRLLPGKWLTKTRHLINPGGSFALGGPAADCGLTGRKIIVDSYGGMCRHGGGAFSGKDPSKVDRSAAYLCRWIAKHIVSCKELAVNRCEVQLSYAIGEAEPGSVSVDTYGALDSRQQDRLADRVRGTFPLAPAQFIKEMGLARSAAKWAYQDTAAFGHFGRPEFPWERVFKNKIRGLKS